MFYENLRWLQYPGFCCPHPDRIRDAAARWMVLSGDFDSLARLLDPPSSFVAVGGTTGNAEAKLARGTWRYILGTSPASTAGLV